MPDVGEWKGVGQGTFCSATSRFGVELEEWVR